MNKLMMKLTIGSEAIFFISLIVAYLYFWRSAGFQQQVSEHLHIKTSSVFTALLLFSSFTFRRAEKNFTKGKQRSMKVWLAVTIVAGLIFLGGQMHEYYQLVSEKVTVSAGEFGSSFYTLTGFHALHVLIGLIILLAVFALSWKGYIKQPSSVLGTVGIYWHFVDVVWLFVFITIYVLPYIL